MVLCWHQLEGGLEERREGRRAERREERREERPLRGRCGLCRCRCQRRRRQRRLNSHLLCHRLQRRLDHLLDHCLRRSHRCLRCLRHLRRLRCRGLRVKMQQATRVLPTRVLSRLPCPQIAPQHQHVDSVVHLGGRGRGTLNGRARRAGGREPLQLSLALLLPLEPPRPPLLLRSSPRRRVRSATVAAASERSRAGVGFGVRLAARLGA